MIYLTVNDMPNGVYKSQVVDAILAMNAHLDEPIELVAMISFRNFKANKAKIKSWYPRATVVRMIPGLSNWKKNKFLLSFIGDIKSKPILARGPMAFWLAHQINSQVSYDGRGAVKGELLEFPDMIPDRDIVDSLIEAEKQAVLNSKYRIAVSSKLVEYWKKEFNYSKQDHIIIPCTLSNDLQDIQFKDTNKREKVKLVYSGSTAGWQSFEKLNQYLSKWIVEQNIEVVFLSPPSYEIDNLKMQFPESVYRLWVDHKDVFQYLSTADYGILIRDQNTTNSVASPVKFAEYLAAGLKVLISPNLGDYSELVDKNHLGSIVSNESMEFITVELEEKKRLHKFALDNLTKSAFESQYCKLVEKICN